MTISDDTRRDHLEAFLADRGGDLRSVLAEVDDAFGETHLIVATGSVLLGFGNSTSDLDLYVVVEEAVSALPILSYLDKLRIDITFHTSESVKEQVDEVRSAWPATAPLGHKEWLRRKRAIDTLSRFAVGADLAGGAAWKAWRDDLEQDWFHEALVRWWEVESLRRLHAARLVDDHRAVLRLFDTIVALLERRTAERGNLYFVSGGGKWIAAKLEAQGDAEGLAVLRRALTTFDRNELEELVEDLLRTDAPHLEECGWHTDYSVLYGVEFLPVGPTVYAHRWASRSVALDAGVHRSWLDAQGEPCQVHSTPAAPWRDLLRADMAWLSVVR